MCGVSSSSVPPPPLLSLFSPPLVCFLLAFSPDLSFPHLLPCRSVDLCPPLPPPLVCACIVPCSPPLLQLFFPTLLFLFSSHAALVCPIVFSSLSFYSAVVCVLVSRERCEQAVLSCGETRCAALRGVPCLFFSPAHQRPSFLPRTLSVELSTAAAHA